MVRKRVVNSGKSKNSWNLRNMLMGSTNNPAWLLVSQRWKMTSEKSLQRRSHRHSHKSFRRGSLRSEALVWWVYVPVCASNKTEINRETWIFLAPGVGHFYHKKCECVLIMWRSISDEFFPLCPYFSFLFRFPAKTNLGMGESKQSFWVSSGGFEFSDSYLDVECSWLNPISLRKTCNPFWLMGKWMVEANFSDCSYFLPTRALSLCTDWFANLVGQA